MLRRSGMYLCAVYGDAMAVEIQSNATCFQDIVLGSATSSQQCPLTRASNSRGENGFVM